MKLDILVKRPKGLGELLDPDGGYSQSELNAMSSVLADTFLSA